MKLSHHIPVRGLRSDPITEQYQAEVDRATDKAMAAWERAQRRLGKAEEKLRILQSRARRKVTQHQLAVARELVELRREELARIEALMKQSPDSAANRGVRSFRPATRLGGTW